MNKIANNPKFHQMWEDLQKSLGNILSTCHIENPDIHDIQVLNGEIDRAKEQLNDIANLPDVRKNVRQFIRGK
jgi:hypothetical protein